VVVEGEVEQMGQTKSAEHRQEMAVLLELMEPEAEAEEVIQEHRQILRVEPEVRASS
jgi:hypothetical protein